MKTPLISVVMSAFNAEKFIATAIKSILNQTYTDFEFIIINDGSTDRTCEIIQSFTDDRIVLIDKSKNAGLITTLNEGIESAKGEYIARMDADDESLPQRFELQIEFMQNNPDIGVLGTAVFWMAGKRNNKIITHPKIHNQCISKLITAPCVFHPTVMIKKSVLANVGYDEQYLYAQDYKLWVDLAKNGAKFANLQTPLLKYNWHSDNISIKKSDEQKKFAKMAQKAYLRYFLGNDFKKELDLALNKTASLQELSVFYGKLSSTKKQSMMRFFRRYIKDNIELLNCKLNNNTNIKLLFYCYKYKLKYWFKR